MYIVRRNWLRFEDLFSHLGQFAGFLWIHERLGHRREGFHYTYILIEVANNEHIHVNLGQQCRDMRLEVLRGDSWLQMDVSCMNAERHGQGN